MSNGNGVTTTLAQAVEAVGEKASEVVEQVKAKAAPVVEKAKAEVARVEKAAKAEVAKVKKAAKAKLKQARASKAGKAVTKVAGTTIVEGKFAVISGDDIVGCYDSYADAISVAYEKCPLDAFLVKRVEFIERVFNVTRAVIVA